MEPIYEYNPAMFRAHPIGFIFCLVLIAVFGLGILILLYWYIRTRMTTLSVTDREIVYEKGILSKDRVGMALKHVRSIKVSQGLLNRIFGVGSIAIYTAGDDPEFLVRDMPHPHEIRDAISRAQESASG